MLALTEGISRKGCYVWGVMNRWKTPRESLYSEEGKQWLGVNV